MGVEGACHSIVSVRLLRFPQIVPDRHEIGGGKLSKPGLHRISLIVRGNGRW